MLEALRDGVEQRIAGREVVRGDLLLLIYGFSRGHWLHGLLSGITLAMSSLPEEYPLVLTVFMAMDAWRISKHQVLTRRANTVEALGSATVMCVDKTGTLTFNRMQLQQLVVNNEVFLATVAMLPESFHELLEFAIRASESAPFDPMEKTILALGKNYLTDTEHLHGDWQLAALSAVPSCSRWTRSRWLSAYGIAIYLHAWCRNKSCVW